jgi:hypothetical protein
MRLGGSLTNESLGPDIRTGSSLHGTRLEPALQVASGPGVARRRSHDPITPQTFKATPDLVVTVHGKLSSLWRVEPRTPTTASLPS